MATVCNMETDIKAEVIDFGYLYEKRKIELHSTLGENLNEMCKYLLELEPDVVSFYSLCSSYHINIMLSKRIKELNKNVFVLFGGPQASLTAEKTLKAFSWVDYIGMDEGEETIVAILRAIVDRLDKMPSGIAYRNPENECEIIITESKECDIDRMEYIDYSLVDMDGVTSIPIDVGRGCPFGCIYCSTKTFWKRKFRLKSISRIISELERLKEKYQINNFAFVHDLFTVNKLSVIEFCENVIGRKLNITWSCSARLDTLSEPLLDYMYEAGCRRIFLGIETGSPKMQKLINKNLNLGLVKDLKYYFQKYNIDFTCSFIYGFPQETEEDLRKTLNVIREVWENGAATIQLHKATILPGTALFQEYKEKLRYNPLCTDFTDPIYIDNEAVGYIKNYKDIFPQFYSIQTVATTYKYLDIFIYYFYTVLSQFLPNTYCHLIQAADNDLLNLYKSFENFIGDIFEEISEKGMNYIEKIYQEDVILKFLNLYFERYFQNEISMEYEMMKFEMDAFNFMKSREKIQIKIYQYDILKMLSKSEVKNRSRITVKFERLDKDKINVMYI